MEKFLVKKIWLDVDPQKGYLKYNNVDFPYFMSNPFHAKQFDGYGEASKAIDACKELDAQNKRHAQDNLHPVPPNYMYQIEKVFI